MTQERMKPRAAAWVELDRYWASIGKWPDQDTLNSIDWRLEELEEEYGFTKESDWKELLDLTLPILNLRAAYDGERILTLVQVGDAP